MVKMPKIAALALFSAAALVFSGCSDASNNSGGAQVETSSQAVGYLRASYDDLKEGGELRLPIVEVPAQQNTLHQDGTAYTFTIWRWYNPVVFLITEDLEYAPNPDYITEWHDEIIDGKTVVTYTLNDQAHYNDGTPINWEAYYNQWVVSRGDRPEDYPANSTDGYSEIESVTQGANEWEVKITFSSIYPWWETVLGPTHPSLLDPTVYKTGYLKQLHPEWGAGPYTVESIDFDQGYVSFIPNPSWWGDKGKLDRITYRQMESQATLNAFKNGEINAATTTTREQLAAVKDMQGIQTTRGMAASKALYALNSDAEILKDPNVRRAIFSAIDLQSLEAIRYDGLDYSAPTGGSFIFYRELPDYQDNFHKAVTYSVEDAKGYLEESGWTLGSDGIYEKDGQPLDITYTMVGDNPVTKSLVLALQKMLKDAGINLVIQNRASKDFSKVIREKEFDMFGYGFSGGGLEGVSNFNQFYGSDSTLNISGTGTKELDEQILEMTKLPTKEEQIARAQELEVEAFKTYGIMPAPVAPEIVTTTEGLANYGAKGLISYPPQMVGWTDKRMES